MHTPSFREGCLRKKRKMLRDTLMAQYAKAVSYHIQRPHPDCAVGLSCCHGGTCPKRSQEVLLRHSNPFGHAASTTETEGRVLLRPVCSSRVRDPDAGMRMSLFLLPALHGGSHLTIQPACLFAEKSKRRRRSECDVAPDTSEIYPIFSRIREFQARFQPPRKRHCASS